MTRPFTTIVLFRDTPAERQYARLSIPSIVALGPDEILVGADEDRGADFDQFVAGIFRKSGYARYRILPVPYDRAWRLHTAHVLWECFEAAKNKVAFACNIDTVIRPSVLAALDAMGRDSTGMISFSLRHKVKTLQDRIRWFYFRRQERRIKTLKGTSGTYWVYLPYVFEAVDRADIMGVANGFDSLLWFRFEDSKYRAHFWHEIGAECMDYENNDLPWRQFCYGAWYGANCEERYVDSRPLKFVRRRLGPSAALKIVHLRAALRLVPEIWEDPVLWNLGGIPLLVSQSGLGNGQGDEGHHVQRLQPQVRRHAGAKAQKMVADGARGFDSVCGALRQQQLLGSVGLPDNDDQF